MQEGMGRVLSGTLHRGDGEGGGETTRGTKEEGRG